MKAKCEKIKKEYIVTNDVFFKAKNMDLYKALSLVKTGNFYYIKAQSCVNNLIYFIKYENIHETSIKSFKGVI
jgi:hypothetical protein